MDKGIIYKPDKKKGLECYVDADFAGGWQHADAESAESVMSRTGYILMYAGCPIHWVSKLQTEIALSTAEAEYIALSQALREVIPMIEMMKDLHRSFPLEITIPNFNCTVHEDNQSCISMANRQKFSPRTKHIALKYHHFRSYVNAKRIEVKYINTHDQLADALTKPLDPETFIRLRKELIHGLSKGLERAIYIFARPTFFRGGTLVTRCRAKIANKPLTKITCTLGAIGSHQFSRRTQPSRPNSMLQPLL
eukprot:scaffold17754_cov71-Skeletonema_dohrnii-CCMP3373.AAC.1